MTFYEHMHPLPMMHCSYTHTPARKCLSSPWPFMNKYVHTLPMMHCSYSTHTPARKCPTMSARLPFLTLVMKAPRRPVSVIFPPTTWGRQRDAEDQSHALLPLDYCTVALGLLTLKSLLVIHTSKTFYTVHVYGCTICSFAHICWCSFVWSTVCIS